MVEYWKEAEDKVEEHFKNLGYTVLNQNNPGFPDMIALKDGKISFFIEVKAKQVPEIGLDQLLYHQYLNELGFDVKCVNVRDKELEFFTPDPIRAEIIKANYPPINKNM